MNSYREILSLWRRPSELAEDIGAKANTVSKWGQRDFIPPEWWNDVESAAKRRGFDGVTVRAMAKMAKARAAA
ncbi:MAG: carph-isopro domain-containing protein [Geminicoccaceae bacterium]